ncbi:MAG TPA: hypothetical protein VGG46_15725 [Terriglobales bacterium]|jgi:uncharacterized membrane protein
MHSTILIAFFEVSRTANSMCAAAIILFLIAILAAKNQIAQASGLDKAIALTNLCFAVPLAVFGAEHLSGAQFIQNGVPAFVPWHLFWAYFVGFALIAASLSIATKIALRWSALLFGLMMFLFVAMIHLPGALQSHGSRIPWTIVFRESSFGGGAWLLAASAMGPRTQASGVQIKSTLIVIGRILVAFALLFFGVVHFLHPTALPGVPLEKQLATWIPARVLIDYITGAALFITGVCALLNQKARTAATWLGSWLLLMLLLIYVPVMIAGMLDPSTAVKVEGINYFADTLLFTGAILAIAKATPRPN